MLHVASDPPNRPPVGRARRDGLAALFSVLAELGEPADIFLTKYGTQDPRAVFPVLRGDALPAASRTRAISKLLIALVRPTTCG